jgi:hypothetical protein
MPEVNSGEGRSKFVSRCISIVMGEGNLDHKAAVGRCNGLFDSYLKKEEITEDENKRLHGKIVAKDVAQRIVYSVALEPNVVDLQGEWESAKDIEEAAHIYLAEHRGTKLSHEEDINASVVESFIAPVDLELNGEYVSKGSWVVAMKIHDEGIWKEVEDGLITGFSIGGKKQFV